MSNFTKRLTRRSATRPAPASAPVVVSGVDTRTDISNIAQLAGWPDDCLVLASAGVMADFVGPSMNVEPGGSFIALLARLLEAEIEDGVRSVGVGPRLAAERLQSSPFENGSVMVVRHDFPGLPPEFTVMYPSED